MKTTILRQLVVLPVLMALMAMLYACGSTAGAARADAQSRRFSVIYVLTPGASVAIDAAPRASVAGLLPAAAPLVKLDRVNDSRCRVGDVCVWAGYISYSFTLTASDGAATSFVLSDGMPGGASTVRHQGLTFALAGDGAQPVPAKNETTPDYRVSLRVSNME